MWRTKFFNPRTFTLAGCNNITRNKMENPSQSKTHAGRKRTGHLKMGQHFCGRLTNMCRWCDTSGMNIKCEKRLNMALLITKCANEFLSHKLTTSFTIWFCYRFDLFNAKEMPKRHILRLHLFFNRKKIKSSSPV